MRRRSGTSDPPGAPVGLKAGKVRQRLVRDGCGAPAHVRRFLPAVLLSQADGRLQIAHGSEAAQEGLAAGRVLAVGWRGQAQEASTRPRVSARAGLAAISVL